MEKERNHRTTYVPRSPYLGPMRSKARNPRSRSHARTALLAESWGGDPKNHRCCLEAEDLSEIAHPISERTQGFKIQSPANHRCEHLYRNQKQLQQGSVDQSKLNSVAAFSSTEEPSRTNPIPPIPVFCADPQTSS